MTRFLALSATALLGASLALAEESHSLVVYTAFFEPHSATVSADDVMVLGMMADLMKGDPSYKMRVVAYTDPVDEDKNDKDLAKERAKAIRDYLEGKGVPKDAIDVKGVGDEESFGRNESETDRALRRRAEIRIRQEARDKRSIDSDLEKDVATKVQTTAFFDFDKSDIKPEFKGVLARLGVMLKNNPHYHIRVFGHTDGQGKPDYNVALGGRRCDAVIAELKKAGALATAVEKASMGAGETIGAQTMNATTSRALSRSVEIKVLKAAGADAPAPTAAIDPSPKKDSETGKGEKKDK